MSATENLAGVADWVMGFKVCGVNEIDSIHYKFAEVTISKLTVWLAVYDVKNGC